MGELDMSYKGLDYHLLTNTHRQWDRHVWLEFYDEIREDIERFRQS